MRTTQIIPTQPPKHITHDPDPTTKQIQETLLCIEMQAKQDLITPLPGQSHFKDEEEKCTISIRLEKVI